MPALIHNNPNNTDFGLDILHPEDAAIAALAYQIWEERGRPVGSPEEDWFIAERELASHPESEGLDDLRHYRVAEEPKTLAAGS